MVRRAVAIALLLAAGCSGADDPETRAIRIEMRNSRFIPAAITVPTGTTVRFVLENDDPIAHEFIIGSEAEQQAHERGHDETHDGAAGAASLEGGERDSVTYTFATPGTLIFGCHKPGHYDYGMKGTITITS